MRAKRRTRVRMMGRMMGRKMKARMRMARKEKKRVKLRWRIRDSKYLPSQSPVLSISPLYYSQISNPDPDPDPSLTNSVLLIADSKLARGCEDVQPG